MGNIHGTYFVSEVLVVDTSQLIFVEGEKAEDLTVYHSSHRICHLCHKDDNKKTILKWLHGHTCGHRSVETWWGWGAGVLGIGCSRTSCGWLKWRGLKGMCKMPICMRLCLLNQQAPGPPRNYTRRTEALQGSHRKNLLASPKCCTPHKFLWSLSVTSNIYCRDSP